MELLALLLPILIDNINRKVANTDWRLWISVGVCAVFAIFLTWIATSFAFINPQAAFDYITKEIMIVFGLAQLSFQAVWKKTDTHTELRDNAKNL